VSLSIGSPASISIASHKTFTYDVVFDSETSQDDLYSSVSSSLLDSFVDGYNATVRTEHGFHHVALQEQSAVSHCCLSAFSLFSDSGIRTDRVWKNVYYGK
jgi:hypothetical protein